MNTILTTLITIALLLAIVIAGLIIYDIFAYRNYNHKLKTLKAAVQKTLDNYLVSIEHYPKYILVRLEDFKDLRLTMKEL
jgi:uncharacterized protein (TIGR02588 family)